MNIGVMKFVWEFGGKNVQFCLSHNGQVLTHKMKKVVTESGDCIFELEMVYY
jgi:hypothetical protein